MPIRLELERRPNDFERDGRVTAFTGSCCCCCCCLHWIGAGAGAVVGMRRGWKAAEESRGAPLDPVSRRSLHLAIAAASILSTIAVAIGIAIGTETLAMWPLMALAFVPSLIVVPIAGAMALSSYALRARMLAEFRRETKKLPARDGADTALSVYRMKLSAPPKTKGALHQFSVFCRECWCELDESMHLPDCPTCGKAIVAPVISGPDFGMGVALRASLTSFGLATAGTAIGYAAMWFMSLFL